MQLGNGLSLSQHNHDIVPDERDAELLRSRYAAWAKRRGPRVGDFLRVGPDRFLRFTHDWGEDIQTTSRTFSGDGSFYLSSDGFASFSGSLDPAIDKRRLTKTDELRNGSFWFFHHDRSGGHRGVGATMPCTVWALIEGDSTHGE